MKAELRKLSVSKPKTVPVFHVGEHSYPWRFGRQTRIFRTRGLYSEELNANAKMEKPGFILVNFVSDLGGGGFGGVSVLEPHQSPILVMDYDKDKQTPHVAPGGLSWDEFAVALTARVEPAGGMVLRSPSGAVKAFFQIDRPIALKDVDAMRAMLLGLAEDLRFPHSWVWKQNGEQAWDASLAGMTLCFFTNEMIAAWELKKSNICEQSPPLSFEQKLIEARGGLLSFGMVGAVGGGGGVSDSRKKRMREGTGSQVEQRSDTCPSVPTTTPHFKTSSNLHRFRGVMPAFVANIIGASRKRASVMRVIMASHGLLNGGVLPQAAIAEATKTSQRFVSKVIADLMTAGLLTRLKKGFRYPKTERGMAAVYRAEGCLHETLAKHHRKHGSPVGERERIERRLHDGTWHSPAMLSLANTFPDRETFLAHLEQQGLDKKKDRRHHANRAFDKVEAARQAKKSHQKVDREKKRARG